MMDLVALCACRIFHVKNYDHIVPSNSDTIQPNGIKQIDFHIEPMRLVNRNAFLWPIDIFAQLI